MSGGTNRTTTAGNASIIAAYCVALGVFHFASEYLPEVIEGFYNTFQQTWVFTIRPLVSLGAALGFWEWGSLRTLSAWLYGTALLALGVAAYSRFSSRVARAATAFFGANLAVYWLLYLISPDWWGSLGKFLVGDFLYTLLMGGGIALFTVWAGTPGPTGRDTSGTEGAGTDTPASATREGSSRGSSRSDSQSTTTTRSDGSSAGGSSSNGTRTTSRGVDATGGESRPSCTDPDPSAGAEERSEPASEKPGDALKSVAGIDEERAATLREYGFGTIDDLRRADGDELTAIPGIDQTLAERVQSDIGTSEGEAGEPVPTADTGSETIDRTPTEADGKTASDPPDETRTGTGTGKPSAGDRTDDRPTTSKAKADPGGSEVIATLLDISGTEEVTADHVEHLTELLDSDDPEKRRRAAEALGAVGEADPELVDPAVDELRSLRLDSAVEVSEAAREALDRIDSTRTS